MKPDKNDTIYWNMDTPILGCGTWPVMMGHLTSYGWSHYLNPSPNYFCPHIILKGRGTVRCGGREHAVSSGDMFSIWPGQAIEYFDVKESPWEYLWIHLGGDGTESFLNGCGFSPDRLVFRPVDPSSVKRLFWQIRSIYSKRDYADLPTIIKYFYELAVACGQWSGQSGPESEHDIARQAVTYIDTMLNTPLDINGIARALNVCRTTLYRAFVKNMNITPIEYLKTRRIERAKELLTTTKLSITEICKTIGFAEQRYFMRCFREKTGLTPSTFRAVSKSQI